MIWFYEALAAIRGFMELGGNVLWAIMLALFLMWTFILERIWYMYKVHPVRKVAILAEWESRADTTSWYARQIRERMISETSVALKDKIGLINALIAICPLLGLLGASLLIPGGGFWLVGQRMRAAIQFSLVVLTFALGLDQSSADNHRGTSG